MVSCCEQSSCLEMAYQGSSCKFQLMSTCSALSKDGGRYIHIHISSRPIQEIVPFGGRNFKMGQTRSLFADVIMVLLRFLSLIGCLMASA